MARFEELQELWQGQEETAPIPFDARGLSEELRSFGRRQTQINVLKAALMVVMLVRIVTRFHWSLLPACGAALMFAGLLRYLVLDWRNQIGISRLDFSSPSVEFVRDAYERLQHQLNPMRRHFWMLVLSIGGGLNLMLLQAHGASMSKRISEHLTATALPFVAYILGAKIREFRFRRECGAVLERLTGLLRAMETHAS